MEIFVGIVFVVTFLSCILNLICMIFGNQDKPWYALTAIIQAFFAVWSGYLIFG